MTEEQLAQLAQINAEANRIPYDAVVGQAEPVDWWTDTPEAGKSWVCRDYVLLKAEWLEQAGWPKSSLTIITCYVETGEYHAVLGVVDPGDPDTTYILDSRFDAPYRMDEPPASYRWVYRQVAGTTEAVPIA